ncbi:putative bifunctional diguanylate cyclase/phosphodiesterase [Rubrimonas cliftonensis]|nr:bifunctional diguanylate cyclase/phosphodiesterase [Rubrimonas cliftonensis]
MGAGFLDAASAAPAVLWRRYLLSMAVIVAAVFAVELSARLNLETGRERALNVAESARQEARLRRLGDTARDFTERPTLAGRIALGETLTLFERGHAALLAESRRAAALRALFDGPDGLDVAARAAAGDARRLLIGAPDPAAALARLQTESRGALAFAMRAAAAAFQAEAARDMRRAEAARTATVAAVLAALLLQAAFVVRPGLRAMRRALAGLRRRGARLARMRAAAMTRENALRAHVRRAERLAREDALTGLANRQGFHEALRERLARDPDGVAVLHIDLERFRQVNDALGQAAGDGVLRHAAEALRRHAGAGAFIARVGGDEFAVMTVDGAGREALTALASRLIGALALPVAVDGEVCRVGASIGVADGRAPDAASRSPTSPFAPATRAAQTLAEAALALDAARRAGGMRSAFFTSDLRARAERARRLSDDLLAGLPRGEIAPFYQPQFCARTLRIVGAEALARWRHPEFGVLAPAEFLPIAEELDLLGEIDHAILVTALGDRAQWRAEGVAVDRVSVNVSMRRLQDEGLIESLRGLDMARGTVAFELLESSFLDARCGAASWNIDTLNEMGVEIEIDDFGTGHASIASVMAVRPRRLKIARELIMPVVDNPRQRDVVRALVGIGRTLGCEIVAEGVETPEHVAAVRALGCDVLQGYALARPMAGDAVAGFAREGAWLRTA